MLVAGGVTAVAAADDDHGAVGEEDGVGCARAMLRGDLALPSLRRACLAEQLGEVSVASALGASRAVGLEPPISEHLIEPAVGLGKSTAVAQRRRRDSGSEMSGDRVARGRGRELEQGGVVGAGASDQSTSVGIQEGGAGRGRIADGGRR